MNDPIVNEIHVESNVVVSAESMAVKNMEKLQQIRQDRKNAREMLTKLYLDDQGYVKNEAAAKKAKSDFQATIAVIGKQKPVYDLKEKIKALNKEYNETKRAISDYLILYQTKSGQLSFIKPDGDTVKIETSAKGVIIRQKKK